jgi:hypothetical protein
MRATLTALAACTLLASLWLCMMYFILRHPGFEWRAALALGFALVGALTVAAVQRPGPGLPLVIAVAVGNVALLAIGAWAIASPHDDGFVDVIGLAFIVQGALALWWTATRLRHSRLAL